MKNEEKPHAKAQRRRGRKKKEKISFCFLCVSAEPKVRSLREIIEEELSVNH
jgi:hypothetical protein